MSSSNGHMLPLKHLVSAAVRRAGISTQVTSAQIVSGVRAFLDAAVLAELKPFIQVISFQNGALKIYCQNSVAAHEVRSLESGIREAILTIDPRSELKHLNIQLHSAHVYDL